MFRFEWVGNKIRLLRRIITSDINYSKAMVKVRFSSAILMYLMVDGDGGSGGR